MQEAIEQSLQTIRSGGTLLYPTDTVWGIGCDATNAAAVQKIIDLKHRNSEKSFIILLPDSNELGRYVKDVPELAWDLIEFAEKPLTIIYPQATALLAPNCVNADGSIAIRIVKQGFCFELMKKMRKPLVSTSANISGEPSPKSFSEIAEAILSGVDYVVNLPDQGTGQPSSLMKLEVDGRFAFLRK